MTIEERLERIENHLGIDDEPEILAVVDPDTGLEWQSEGSSNQMDLGAALKYCDSLNEKNYGGHSDWRLPTRVELYTLVVDERHDPCIKSLPGFKCQSSSYWSATTIAYSTTYAWYVDFNDGYVSNVSKTDSYYVRCIRGGRG